MKQTRIKLVKCLQIYKKRDTSKNWTAGYHSASLFISKSCKTSDVELAKKFAMIWYKETVIPKLQNKLQTSTKSKVIDFVFDKCTLLGSSKWNSETYSFPDLPVCMTKQAGVYFVVSGKKILKVGKADGSKGLQTRLSSYRLNNRSRVWGNFPDQFTVTLNEKMTTLLKNKTLSFYYFEIPKKETTLEGFKVQTCMARSFEKELSIHARLQGHPMTLSGSD
jgi:hypothetical protein